MMNRYKFYNFVDYVQAIEGRMKNVIRNIFLEFETTADQPLRAFNEYRKSQTDFDFLIENGETILLRQGLSFIPVDFSNLKKYVESSRPDVVFTIEEEPFKKAIA